MALSVCFFLNKQQSIFPIIMMRLLLPLLILFFSSPIFAIQQEKGRVSMNGVIINPACAIYSDTLDQTVDLGIIPIERITELPSGEGYPFSITLMNCILQSNNNSTTQYSTFSLAFDGPTENGNNLFALSGDAKGVSFELRDEQGKKITPGLGISHHGVLDEKKTLNYSLHLIRNSTLPQSGRFHAAVHFILTYQ
ncbi:fimbrial protein [Yersinia proxima]|uniref:fimbrial protein n=1 Tax=Yersinia proxima TaxID=2890316 RepID=UPI0009817A47|nr:fimbrial protein [Yersinia proxima]